MHTMNIKTIDFQAKYLQAEEGYYLPSSSNSFLYGTLGTCFFENPPPIRSYSPINSVNLSCFSLDFRTFQF